MEDNILFCPIDFSECANNALNFAIPLSKALNCKIKLVHDVDLRSITSVGMNEWNILEKLGELEETATKKLKMLQEQVEQDGVNCEYQVIKGERELELIELIENLKPKLVVMGTTGTGGFQNKVMGSLTYRIIKKTPMPVLAVPEKASFEGLRTIIFASDFENPDLQPVRLLVKIAAYFKSDLDIVCIFETTLRGEKEGEKSFLVEYKDYVSNHVSYPKVDYKLLHWENVEDRLATFLDNSHADLLALMDREPNFFKRLFGSGLTKKMFYNTKIPLLVFP